jgi:hypothetical protein
MKIHTVLSSFCKALSLAMALWLLIALGLASVRIHQTVTAAVVQPSNREALECNERDTKTFEDRVHGGSMADVRPQFEG